MRVEKANVLSAENLASLNRARAAVYAFLARVYRHEVDGSLLTNLDQAASGARAIAGLSTSPAARRLAQAAELLGVFAREAQALDEASRGELLVGLATDYATLFLGHGPKPVHPYESVHLGDELLVLQHPRDQVVAAYSEAGFSVSREAKEPEDHLAIELEYVAALCSAAAKSVEHGEREDAARYAALQRRFMDEHLARWAPAVGRAVQSAAASKFYSSIGAITESFVDLDARELSTLASQT